MKNKGTWIIVGIVAAFVLLIAGIFVSTNNRAVSLEEQVFTADSDIQAQEKRRTGSDLQSGRLRQGVR